MFIASLPSIFPIHRPTTDRADKIRRRHDNNDHYRTIILHNMNGIILYLTIISQNNIITSQRQITRNKFRTVIINIHRRRAPLTTPASPGESHFNSSGYGEIIKYILGISADYAHVSTAVVTVTGTAVRATKVSDKYGH